MIEVQHVVLPEADRGYIYFAEFTIDGDSFMKVGYSRNPNRRFLVEFEEFNEVETHVQFKNIIPMQDWMFDFPEGNPSSDYWEQRLHVVLRNAGLQYTPEVEFSGVTECYKLTSRDYKAAIDYLEENLQDMNPKMGFVIQY